MAATDIINSCNKHFLAVEHDCNKFLKAVAADAFKQQPFTGTADNIIAYLRTGNGWTDLVRNHDSAISEAKTGKFVVAGMTSTELGGAHGHVAVVNGVDGDASGPVKKVPKGHARSLADQSVPQNQQGPNEVKGQKISGTFPAKKVQAGEVSYYSRAPDKF